MLDRYVSVDVEAIGSCPHRNGMASIGAVFIDRIDDMGFYAELKPYGKYDVRTQKFHKMSLSTLVTCGFDLDVALRLFDAWLKRRLRDGERPVFCGWPLGYDFKMLDAGYQTAKMKNPFGFGSGVDIRSYWMGLLGLGHGQVSKESVRRFLEKLGVADLGGYVHTHNALDDAREQAMLLREILNARSPSDVLRRWME